MKKLVFLLVVSVAFSTLIKAQTAGDLNTDFGTDGIQQFAPSPSFDQPNAILVQPDGKILTIGRARIDGQKYHVYISRHQANGTLDNSFGNEGIISLLPFANYDNNVFDAKLLDDGKIIICGYLFGGANNWKPFLMKLNNDGSYDTNFGNGGYMSYDYAGVTIADAMAIQNDGKIVMVGYISNPSDKTAVMRYTANGERDNTFGDNGMLILDVPNAFDSDGFDIDIQSDGKILATGIYTNKTNFDYEGFIARINTDGSIDNTFGNNGFAVGNMGEGHDFLSRIYAHKDGKIYVGGHSWITNGPPALWYNFCMLRLNSDGSLDNTYGNAGVASIKYKEAGNYCKDFVVSETGKVYAVSNYENQPEQVYDISIFSFDENGMPNNTFGDNGIVNLGIENFTDAVGNIAFYNDSSLLVCGATSTTSASSDIILANYWSDIEFDNITEPNSIDKTRLKAYPNPTNKLLTLTSNTHKGMYEAKVYNLMGAMVLKQTLHLPGILNVETLPNGSYIVTLTSKKEILTHRFVKQ